MYDRTLVLDILGQIDGALQRVRDRSRRIASADELTATPEGEVGPLSEAIRRMIDELGA